MVEQVAPKEDKNRRFPPLSKPKQTQTQKPISNIKNEEFSTLSPEDKIKWLNSKIAKTEAGLNDLVQGAAVDRAMNNIYHWKQQLSLLNSGKEYIEDDDDDMDVFEVITLNSKQVARRRSNSLIVTGNAGVGKTMTVIKAISFLKKILEDKIEKIRQEAETVDAEFEEIKEATDIKIEEKEEEKPSKPTRLPPISKKKDKDKESKLSITKVVTESRNNVDSGYFIASGTCTCAALYELLFLYRDKLLIFDDFDSVLKDDECLNLLKAALDTYPVRELSKMTMGNTFNSLGMTDAEMQERYELDGKLPNQFQFRGNIIFISNIHEDKFDEALLSRSLHVEVRLTREEIIKRMHTIMPDIRPEVSMEHKMEALNHLEFITEHYPCKFPLNIRSLIHAIDFRSEYPEEKTILPSGKEVMTWQQLLKKLIVKTKIKV